MSHPSDFYRKDGTRGVIIDRDPEWTSRDDALSRMHTLYHCVAIDHEECGEVYDPHAIGRGFEFRSRSELLGFQTLAHTNWPRNPEIGLPQGWKFKVTRVAARISTLDYSGWMDDVSVRWELEHKTVFEGILAELVLGGRATDYVIRECMSNRCRITLNVKSPARIRIWPQLEGRLLQEGW